jgi:hypothetical protein
VFFVIEYAGWLWFFGHNMHPWGAFTVKPFMPTVFGEGKVAQFSTYSYPYWGYALLLLASACLMPALLLRRSRCATRRGAAEDHETEALAVLAAGPAAGCFSCWWRVRPIATMTQAAQPGGDGRPVHRAAGRRRSAQADLCCTSATSACTA